MSPFLLPTNPTTGLVTSITAGDDFTNKFTDDDGDVISTGTNSSGSEPVSSQAHAKLTDDFTDKSSLSITVLGQAASDTAVDFLQYDTNTDVGDDSNDFQDQSPDIGTDNVTDKFDRHDADKIDGGGHSYETITETGDDHAGNTTQVQNTFGDDFGLTGNFDNKDMGLETFADVNNVVTDDTEEDTDTLSGELDPSQTLTTRLHDSFATYDPNTQLGTTTAYDENSSDEVVKQDKFNSTDVHSQSPTNPGSDILSGKNDLSGSETGNEYDANTVRFWETLSNNESIGATNTLTVADKFSDKFSNVDELTPDGKNTDTISFGGNFDVTKLSDTLSEADSVTDPTTGITTTQTIGDSVEGQSSDIEIDSDTTTTTSTGATTDVPSLSDSATLEQDWSLSETVSQTDANGNPVTTSTTTSDVGSDTEIEQNGVITDPGGTNTHTVTSVSTSGQTTPQSSPQPPGQPTPPATAEPPAVNATQQQIAGLQREIADAKKKFAAAEAKNVAIQRSWSSIFGYSAAQKAALDKLAAEQADAANSIAMLEKKIDAENAKLDIQDQPRLGYRAPADLDDPTSAALNSIASLETVSRSYVSAIGAVDGIRQKTTYAWGSMLERAFGMKPKAFDSIDPFTTKLLPNDYASGLYIGQTAGNVWNVAAIFRSLYQIWNFRTPTIPSAPSPSPPSQLAAVGGIAFVASTSNLGRLLIAAKGLGLSVVAVSPIIAKGALGVIGLSVYSIGDGNPGSAPNSGPLRSRIGNPPAGMKKPQAHHDLPQADRFSKQWERAGLDNNDSAFGRWVEGGPVGDHQKWSKAFNDEWDGFFERFPQATKEQILEQMNRLRNDPRFQ